MLIRQILMAVIGLSAGILVAGGLFGFIVELGVIADFADRTIQEIKFICMKTVPL